MYMYNNLMMYAGWYSMCDVYIVAVHVVR